MNRVIECLNILPETEIRLFVINQISTSILFDYLLPWIFCTIIMSNEFKVLSYEQMSCKTKSE